MKPTHVMDFSPPMEGLFGVPTPFMPADVFNTFRLGRVWAKRLHPSDTVLLMDKPHMLAFGKARVTVVYTGKLLELAKEHAHRNHNQLGHPKRGAWKRLMENMTRRYGPHIVHENKLTTVIYLERIE